MTSQHFEWDEAKNISNRKKHGLGFQEASTVFDDPFHVSILDREEDREQRWKTFGLGSSKALIVVAHTVIEADGEGTPVDVIRIISARLAGKKEKKIYENENG